MTSNEQTSPEYFYARHRLFVNELYIARTREIKDEEIGDPKELRGVIETIDFELLLHEVNQDEVTDLNLALLSGQGIDNPQIEATVASLAYSQDLLDLRAEAIQSPLLMAKIAMRSIRVSGARARYNIDLLIAADALNKNYDAWYKEALIEDVEQTQS